MSLDAILKHEIPKLLMDVVQYLTIYFQTLNNLLVRVLQR